MKRFALLTGVLLLLGATALARWGTGGCSGQSISPPAQEYAPAQYHWVWPKDPEDKGRAYLYLGGVQVGAWDYWKFRYLPFSNGVWGSPQAKSPITVPPAKEEWFIFPVVPEANEKPAARAVQDPPGPEPAPPKQPDEIVQDFGVDWSKIADHRITYEGRVISCEKAHEMIEGQIPDDTKKFCLVVIGSKDLCKPVTDALDADAPLKARTRVWCVPPSDWSLRPEGVGEPVWKTDGSPMVYFQAPDGKVLHRQGDGKDVVDAIRKAVKAYDASKDPDLRKPQPTPSPLGPSDKTLPLLLLAGGAATFVVLSKRKKS